MAQAPDGKARLRAQSLWQLAARFRAHAAETGVTLYQRKFEGTASELEEAALDAETRAWGRADLKHAC